MKIEMKVLPQFDWIRIRKGVRRYVVCYEFVRDNFPDIDSTKPIVISASDTSKSGKSFLFQLETKENYIHLRPMLMWKKSRFVEWKQNQCAFLLAQYHLTKAFGLKPGKTKRLFVNVKNV